MKTLYLDCSMGASGDMLVSALFDLIEDKFTAEEKIGAIAASLPGVGYRISESKRGAVSGLHTSVRIGGEEEHAPNGDHSHAHTHSHSHSHAGLATILHYVQSLPGSDKIRAEVTDVYNLIAAAESRAHGEDVELIHFHELGALDAVFDIASVCTLLELIGADEIVASPVNVGGGSVKTAHGLVPVPAPATAFLLQGVPTYGDGELLFELCTPTGAALIKRFATSFGVQPSMSVSAIGCGLGKMDFPSRPNILRAMYGVREDSRSAFPNEEVIELLCNIDDMTGEQLGRAADLLREEGALDVSLIPMTGKKSRPGVIVQCICKVEDEAKFARLLLTHTTTFGVRGRRMFRYALERDFSTREDGVVLKHGHGYGVQKSKEEFDTTILYGV
ncbi:MAG: LarC family nickel insertion protein [Oscillospiraceae bacterium]|jgi:uncharacterized protein (TIGR00299 family) protein|nr:LarC family nickel insertion protein [Oscillospiraceae bacterium]